MTEPTFTHIGVVTRTEVGRCFASVASDLYVCSDCGCVVVDREAHTHPATTEPAVLEHDGLGQATTNRKEA